VAKKRILLLSSGSGSIAEAIFSAVDSGELDLEIVALISDRDSQSLVRAKSHQVDSHYLPVGSDRQEWNQRLLNLVIDHEPDLVVSVGFMRILEPDFVRRFKVLNTHPALLPAFPGAHAVRDALAAGVSITGTTVHWVDEGVDTGPIIEQVEVPVLPGDSQSELHERIKIQERILIVETLKKLTNSGEQ